MVDVNAWFQELYIWRNEKYLSILNLHEYIFQTFVIAKQKYPCIFSVWKLIIFSCDFFVNLTNAAERKNERIIDGF